MAWFILVPALLAGLAIVLLVGCRPAVIPSNPVGIPNLVEVAPGLWRSGQPTTDEQWAYLAQVLNIRTVVKLNFDGEGSDEGAVRNGLRVEHLSIQPEGDIDVWDELVGTFKKPDPALVGEAVGVMSTARPGAGVLVHCTHGQDRTGLAVAAYRVIVDGWSKERAWDEAIQLGFHPELTGLDAFWVNNVEEN
jgi:hypothetical protein